MGNQVDSFEVFFSLGKTFFNLEKFQEANEHLKKALTLSNNEEQRQRLVIWVNKTEIELNEINLKGNLTETKETVTVVNPSNIKFINNWFQTASHITITIDSSSPL